MPPRKPTLSTENVHLLIKSVRERPCIWNQDDKDYNDKTHLSSAWVEISKILQLPEDYIRAKWKNVRDLFKREIRRTQPTSLESYKGKWRFFQYLWFLFRPEETCPEVDIEDSEDTRTHFIKYEALDPDSETEVYLEEEMDDPVAPKRRKTSDDFDMMFLKSLTPFLNELEPKRKLVVRNKMQQLLLNELEAQNYSHGHKSDF